MSGADGENPGNKLPHSHRPRSGSETRQRGGYIGFRATDGERAAAKVAADRAGLTVSAYARAQMLAEPVMRATRRPSADMAALAQVLAQLGKCGSNLNQIARVLNSGGEVTPERLIVALEDFRAACASVMRALGRPYGQDSGEAVA
jgi:hypothetical protein